MGQATDAGQGAGDEFEPFNLETMSGVFPGSRTTQFERIRLRPLEQPDDEIRWARLFWNDEPRSCVLYLQARTSQDEKPLFQLRIADPDRLLVDLRAALGQAGYSFEACATCQHWQPAANLDDDQLPGGHCGWRRPGESIPPEMNVITAQSGLALSCLHWTRTTAVQTISDAPSNLRRDLPGANESLPRAAVEKKAEEQASRSMWGRFKRLIGREGADSGNTVPSWRVRLIEQSGIGAGTEPCLACQGRIANLGSQHTQTAEGDEQSFGVWRCRRCHTLYLNHWIDRWMRLDTLETVESHYRLAPAEAVTLLVAIEQQAGDEQFKTILTSHPPLVTQVKHGR